MIHYTARSMSRLNRGIADGQDFLYNVKAVCVCVGGGGGGVPGYREISAQMDFHYKLKTASHGNRAIRISRPTFGK